MYRVLAHAIIPFFCLLAIGCGEAVVKEVPVKGTVTLDGQPLPAGKIFISVTGAPARVLEITNGSFSGTALPGKSRVEVGVFKAGPPLSTSPDKPGPEVNTLPAKYHSASTFTADVTAKGPNDFKFEVTSN